jgi:ATP-dependent Lon protease
VGRRRLLRTPLTRSNGFFKCRNTATAASGPQETIEKPILDRFSVFQIEEPSKEHMAQVIKNLYQRFLTHHPAGAFFEQQIRSDVLDELCQYPPRQVRKMLASSFGFAALKQRQYLSLRDVQRSKDKSQVKQGIGFLSSIS